MVRKLCHNYTNVANQVPTFTITETNLYAIVVTLSIQNNAKLLPQLKSGFKRTISWNKYPPKPDLLAQNANLNHLVEPKCRNQRLQRYDWCKKLYWSTNKKYKVTYENIRKIATGQGDDYMAGCLLDYIGFKNYYKMIAVDLSKQQALDADPKAIQQINFTANFDRAGNTRFYFILKEVKETVFEFSQGTVKIL